MPAAQSEIRYAKGEALLLAEQKLRSASKEELESDAMKAAQKGSGHYKSCPWIEGNAFIANGAVKLCCYASMGGRGSTELFRGKTWLDLDKIPSSEIIAAKNKVRLANQTTDSLCAGCYDLKEAEWQARDHFHVIATAGTLHCNLSCSYCVTYNFSKDRGSPLAPLFESYIKDGSLRPGGYIDFGGGESTLHRDFGAVANLAFDHGIYMNVFTNATAFSREVALGLEKELASVICSVDAGTAPTYKRIKGKDFLDKVWATLARYATVNRMRVFAKYIVMDSNCSAEEIDEFINRAVAANIRNIVAATNVYNNSGNDGTLPSHIVNAIAYLVAQAKKNDLTITYSDVYSPHALDAIAQASEDSRILESVRSSLTNRVGPLEIAFVDAEIFLLRILTMLVTEDDFRVVLPNPLESGSAAPASLGIVAQAALANSAYSAARGPEGPFVRSLSEAALDSTGDWSERLSGMGAYALELRLDPSGKKLAALEFTRRGDTAKVRRKARANIASPAAGAAPTLPRSGSNGKDLNPGPGTVVAADTSSAPMEQPHRSAPDLLDLVPGAVSADRDQDDERLRVTLSPTLLSETNAPIAVIANLILQSASDSWFRVILNDVEMLLPRNTILTMRHCIRPGTEGPISLYVEEDHLPWILSHLSDAGVFLDVGAATGAVTLPVAFTNPELLVFAFEPARRARELLVGTLQRNGIKTVEVVASAVSDLAGQAAFSEYQLAVPGQPPYLPEASAIHHDLINSSLVEAQYDVDVTSLDKFCAERGLMTTPSVVKIDVEGFETKVLEGARQYIASARPWMAIDIHRDPFGDGGTTELPVRAILDQLGYEFENMKHILLCKPLSSGVAISKGQSPEPLGSAPCLLDLVPGAVAAFGLRRLRADVGSNDPGGIIRLRRDSNGDDENLDTLADGRLDLTAVAESLGGSAANCAAWYDQSGNGNHAEAVAAGPTFDLSPDDGRPMLRFQPPAELRSPVTLEGLPAFSIFAVFRAASLAEATSVARWQKDGDFVVFPYHTGDVLVGHHGGPIDRAPLGISRGKFEVYGVVWEQGAADGFTTYRNGSMVMQRAAGSAAIAVGNEPLFIGSYAGLCEHFTGDLVELVIWPRALSDDEIGTVSGNMGVGRAINPLG